MRDCARLKSPPDESARFHSGTKTAKKVRAIKILAQKVEEVRSLIVTLTSCAVPRGHNFQLVHDSMAHTANNERYRHWCFTLNNYNDDDLDQLRQLAPGCKYLVYGKEVGDAGTKHLQGFVSFPNPRRVSTLHTWFHHSAHWEVARDPRAAATYCKKDGDFEEHGTSPEQSCSKRGQRSDLEDLRDAINEGESDRKKLRQDFPGVCAKYPNFVAQLLADQVPAPELEYHPLREWQSELLNVLKGPPNDRTIIFIVDRTGGEGKTWFARYYERTVGRTIRLKPGKKADMVYAFMQQLQADTKVVFIDAPRSKQGEYIQYDFLEELKDGSMLNTKYESRMLEFPRLHVVVMMNELPDMSKLSDDRYKVIEI